MKGFTWRNLKTQQSAVILDLCLMRFVQGNLLIMATSSFSKFVFNHTEIKAGIYKFVRFEERFRKAPFS